MVGPFCRIARRLAPGADDGCLGPWLGAWVHRHARGCAGCGLALRDLGMIGSALRRLEAPVMTDGQAEALWRAIRRDVETRPHGSWEARAALRWVWGLAIRRPAAAWVAGAAVAAIALAVLVRSPESRRTLQAGLNALTVIESVEAGSNTSVFVLETPAERLHVIWVVEPPAPRPRAKPGKEGSDLWPAVPPRPLHASPSWPSSWG